MPQIWLTYQEMADAFGTTPAQAREGAIGGGLRRVKGHDGVAHVLLTPVLAQQYLTGLLAQAGGEGSHPGHMVVSLRVALQGLESDVQPQVNRTSRPPSARAA